jgi:hypothetical protein
MNKDECNSIIKIIRQCRKKEASKVSSRLRYYGKENLTQYDMNYINSSYLDRYDKKYLDLIK